MRDLARHPSRPSARPRRAISKRSVISTPLGMLGSITLAAMLTAALFIVAAFTTPTGAADLPRTILPPPVIVDDGLCTITADRGFVEVFQEPQGESSGFLPAGMIVEVMDEPYTQFTDLWVRIKPPRHSHYYGWVETATFHCV